MRFDAQIRARLADCGNHVPNVNCGCGWHRNWMRTHSNHPAVKADRARTVKWMAERYDPRNQTTINPATGQVLKRHEAERWLKEWYGR